MAQAGSAAPSSAPVRAPRPVWLGPLVAGLCCGLAYGATQRLLALNVGELIHFGPGFDVQVFPGTSLESLKLRFGAPEAELRGDLELQQLERQQQQEARERQEAARQAEAELRQVQEQDPERQDPATDPPAPEAQTQDPAPAVPEAPPAPAGQL